MTAANLSYRIARPQVASELLDGEYVLIHFESGSYYSVQGTGAELVSLLETGATMGQAIDELKTRYPDAGATIDGEVAAFLSHLLEERLLAPADANAPVAKHEPLRSGRQPIRGAATGSLHGHAGSVASRSDSRCRRRGLALAASGSRLTRMSRETHESPFE